MRALIICAIAAGVLPAAAFGRHNDRYGWRDTDERPIHVRERLPARHARGEHEVDRERYHSSHRREQSHYREPYHHVHHRVHHHYEDHGDHSHVRHHTHRRVHHHYGH